MTDRRRPRPADTTAVGDRQALGGWRSTARTPGLTAVPSPPAPNRAGTRRREPAPRSMRWPLLVRPEVPVRSPFRVQSSVPRKRTVSVHAGALVPTLLLTLLAACARSFSASGAATDRRGRCRVRRSQRVRGGWVRVQVREPRVLFREILLGDARRQRLMSARPRDYVRPRGDRSDEDRLLMGPRCPAPRHPQPARPLAPGSRGQLARPLKGRGRRLLRAR